MLVAIALVIGAYLVGSLSSAVLVGRALGHGDPREFGSGNPGATNVLRSFGRLAASLTLLGDVIKGTIPVWLAVGLGVSPAVTATVGVAALLGHLFPVFFDFRGGKGVATYIGVLLGLGWPLAAAFAGVWLIVAAAFRYASAASLSAALLSPVVAHALDFPRAYVIAMLAMTVLVTGRHHANIASLIAGRERRL
jgi:glycerol-3-phosphate acyltransferase PlsY